MPEYSFDVIVIGAGHNGLVAAGYLARTGYRVLVLERRDIVGGAASTEAILPGYWVDTGSFDASLFSARIISEFGLRKHDLRFIESPVMAFAPQVDGAALTLWRDQTRNESEIARFSKPDAANFIEFQQKISRIGAILRSVIQLAPPDLRKYPMSEIMPWIRNAMDVKRLGRDEMAELIRLLPMPVADMLDEWFETALLKGVLGSLGVTGLMSGPSSPGTAFMFLYNTLSSHPGQVYASTFVRGGMINLSRALANEAQSRGATIRTGGKVKEVLIENDRACGVLLEDGTVIHSKAILSNASPRHTFMDLVGSKHLPVEFVRELMNIRYQGCVARLAFGLNDLPRFRSATYRENDLKEGALLSGHIIISPSIEYLERAYDEAKYGNPSQQPVLDIAIPTILDPSRAPKGKHLMLVDAQYTPYKLKHSIWDEKKGDFIDRVKDVLEDYAPGFKQRVEAQIIITPDDFEKQLGLPEGCIHHGQMALDQLFFMRPVPQYSRYRSPIRGLYLCGAGTHPGGGVTGLPGYNAAIMAARDLSSGYV